MALEEHLQIIRQGVGVWNEWRRNNFESIPDLSEALIVDAHLNGADLSRANLRKAHLREAHLRKVDLSGADLFEAKLTRARLGEALIVEANLSGTDLRWADLGGASLRWANLSKADLRWANLGGTDLYSADLSEANLSEAHLECPLLIRTDLRGASLSDSYVYGASVWDIKVDDQTEQKNLVITREPKITVDNIKIAQFIYLLLNNKEIRDVIDTIGKKAVLILGRFSEKRKPILDAIRDELRKPEHKYLPIVFDFQPSTNQTTIETIKTLANMARFVIADITDARSVLQELQAIVPGLPSVAVRLLIKKSEHEYGMLDYIRAYRSVVEETYEYESMEELIASIKENVIVPAEAKVKELRQRL
jgi:Pentapeptide repeats (8 copies)